jgi:hypothetical protein
VNAADQFVITGLYLFAFLPAALLLQYARLRVQNLWAARPDPELGRKAVCHLFLTVAILLGLFGVTVSVADLALRAVEPLKQAQNPAPPGAAPAPTPWFNSSQRTAAAFALSGLLHGTLFALVLRLFTNDHIAPAVRRSHYGLRLVFACAIWMFGGTAVLLILFGEGSMNWDSLALLSPLVLVWGPTAAVHLWLLLRDERRPAGDE